MYDIGTGILILIKNKTDINSPSKIDKFEYLKKRIKKDFQILNSIFSFFIGSDSYCVFDRDYEDFSVARFSSYSILRNNFYYFLVF